MIEPLIPYDLPRPAKTQILALAAESDLLLFGETHGTQEVPRLVLGLLPDLTRLGYSGLALEVPASQRSQLVGCAQGKAAPPPLFGPCEFQSGIGNAQALSLVEQALTGSWQLLCFDVDFLEEGSVWSDRDRGMARNLREQWEQDCPGGKVLGICGNYHSRLAPPAEPTDLWPSFAFSFQQAQPERRVNSVNLTFGRGAFFNGEVRTFDNGPEHFAVQAEVRSARRMEHTLNLHLPRATPVTFPITPPD